MTEIVFYSREFKLTEINMASIVPAEAVPHTRPMFRMQRISRMSVLECSIVVNSTNSR